jgi:hypothetical protein
MPISSLLAMRGGIASRFLWRWIEALELELRGDLNDARLNGGAIDKAESGIGDARSEVDPVEDIEEISTDLNVVVLKDLRCLCQGQVDALLTWGAQ